MMYADNRNAQKPEKRKTRRHESLICPVSLRRNFIEVTHLPKVAFLTLLPAFEVTSQSEWQRLRACDGSLGKKVEKSAP